VAATLNKASLVGAKAAAASFSHSYCDYADFSESWLCNEEQVEQSFKRNENFHSDLIVKKWEGASFAGARLKGANFQKAHLCGVDFSNADLTCVAFQEADLRGANFSGAKLCGANLSRSNLTAARNLEKADLKWAVLLEGLTIDLDLSTHRHYGKILLSKEAVQK